MHQGAEMNQYTLTSGAMARGQTLGINVENSTLIDKNRRTTTTSSRNKPTKTSIPVPPNFYLMEDDDTLFQEAEVTRDAQRSDNLKKSLFESRKAKKVFEVAQGAKETETIGFACLFESRKAKKVVEVVQDAEGIETSPCETERAKNVRGTNIFKNVLQLRPGEKLKVTFYQNRVVGQNHTSFTRTWV
ncbi:hypothetical protein H5410_003364 [Solanum commersonii]|uniref:Uncharacterized protein n=1 Tax=Solanum commersonii TaxID=4109 RepID=A0A9J6B5F8_SOLCO|nr:hypothetical protein H5410_003364 [Solanum commersonii]